MLHTIRLWLARAPRQPFKLARYVLRGVRTSSRARVQDADRPVVLVVDSDRALADSIGEMLAAEACQPRVVYDGWQGLEICQRERVDVVLIDTMMPHMDGLEMLAALRADARLANIAVIFFSDYTRSPYVDRVRAVGVDTIVSKSVPRSFLRSVVRGHITRASARRTPS